MSRKRRGRKRSPRNRAGSAAAATVHATAQEDSRQAGAISRAEADEVGRYVAANDTRAAVKKAKAIHRRLATAESEAFLVDTYAARIRAMASAGLAAEAEALTDLVRTRYACGAERLADGQDAREPRDQSLGAWLEELARPELTSQRRWQIEERIRREAADLPGLAGCEHLPAGHPLRRQAAALWEAFEAVTTGTVEDERIALREVPRRSPLADWKLLVRAIACFYRQEDDACRRLLGAMNPTSAAARLADPLRAMLAGSADAAAGPAAALASAVAGSDRTLRRALGKLEGLFQREDTRKVYGAIRQAVESCGRARPELLDPLKQSIAVRCLLVGCPVGKVRSALGGPSLHDARFWRLMARFWEMEGDPLQACAYWEQFRRHAIHEGWFGEGGPETAVLYLHMTRLIQRIPPEEYPAARRGFERHFPGLAFYYKGQPPSVGALGPDPKGRRDYYFLYPDRIFRRICDAGGDAESFARWLECARSSPLAETRPEDVAERWHEAVRDDCRPLLFLMQAAEGRKAFTKALKFLEKAEALDALNPDVRRARLRLWVLKAIRHLRDGKVHLARKDFAAIEQLAQSREGDRPAMVVALRWVGAKRAGDEAAAEARRGELVDLLGGDGPASVLLTCAGQLTAKAGAPAPGGSVPKAGKELVGAVGRACVLCRDFGLKWRIPAAWYRRLENALASKAGVHDPAGLRALAEAALEEGRSNIAFAAAGAGLRMGGALRARFLLLRARSLDFIPWRQRECLDVAGELARRQRDTDLLAEVIDHGREGFGVFEEAELDVEDKFVEQVLKRETAAAKYGEALRGSASRRRSRSAAPAGMPSLFDDFLDEEDYEDDDDLFPPPLPFDLFGSGPGGAGFLDEEEEDEDDWCDEHGGPPFDGPLPPAELLEFFVEILRRCGGRFPSQGKLDRIVDADPKLRRRAERLYRKYGAPAEWDLPGSAGPSGPASRRPSARDQRRRKRKRDRRNRKR